MTSAPNSQLAFAAQVGCSPATIQSIELGRMTPGESLLARIRHYTGAEPTEIVKGKEGRAVTIHGQPYSKEWFEEWRRRSLCADIPWATKRVKSLLFEASHSGKFPQIYESLIEWMGDVGILLIHEQ